MKYFQLRDIKKLYFGYEDIARILGISQNSAKITAHRYVKQGMLIRVKRNIYILKERWTSFDREQKFIIANIFQVPSYISLMTALDYYEITTQIQRDFIESVVIKRTIRKEIDHTVLNYTKINADVYWGFLKHQEFFVAEPEKAFLDGVYLMSFGRYELDMPSIDFNKLDLEKIERMVLLEKLKNARLLDSLVFGGGTMLRLCHELKRYSVDLDFWRIKDTAETTLFDKIKDILQQNYDITDAQMKHFTILLEIRSGYFPKRLKIEIRKEIRDWDFQEKIAYSKFSTKQVVLKAHTLEQTMKNKIAALLERVEIRDGFDIEFLLRQGILLPDLSGADKTKMIARLDGFKENDFKVKLGSILESDIRAYYIENQFNYLRQKLASFEI
jgi:hypothetical protein